MLKIRRPSTGDTRTSATLVISNFNLKARMRTWLIPFFLCAILALLAHEASGNAFIARTTRPALVSTSAFSVGRGGATVSADDEALTTAEEEESEDDEEEEEEEKENESINIAGTKLAAATVSAASKTKSKAAAAKKASVKTEVNKKLASSPATTKKKSKSLMKMLHIPYILRACLNPITFFSMTKAYWASLMNLDYLKKADASQDLRSALEEKAKKGGSASTKGRRKMKRGQAKTLSDLPQLNT